jgi:AcrR family transcriptional regulator
MKTRELIREQGRELFNREGVMFVTLRDVAKALGKAYGNITYHYPSKEVLIKELYDAMVTELQQAGSALLQGSPALVKLLGAPVHTFEISLKYLFLLKDYVDIMRNNPEVARAARESNAIRKQCYLGLLKSLQEEGMLQPGLQEEDLDYLMELSGAMRTFFFMQVDTSELEQPGLKISYVRYVNRLLYPYLSEKGREVYREAESNY